MVCNKVLCILPVPCSLSLWEGSGEGESVLILLELLKLLLYMKNLASLAGPG